MLTMRSCNNFPLSRLRPPAKAGEHMSEPPFNAEKTAQFLWSLLDDIDTVSDIAKSNDKVYRAAVERIQRRRFEVGSTDGYIVTFHSRRDVPTETEA